MGRPTRLGHATPEDGWGSSSGSIARSTPPSPTHPRPGWMGRCGGSPQRPTTRACRWRPAVRWPRSAVGVAGGRRSPGWPPSRRPRPRSTWSSSPSAVAVAPTERASRCRRAAMYRCRIHGRSRRGTPPPLSRLPMVPVRRYRQSACRCTCWPRSSATREFTPACTIPAMCSPARCSDRCWPT